MDSIRSTVSIALHNVKKSMTNPRILVIIILIPSLLSLAIGPINDFARITGYKVRPFLMPFLFSDSYMVFMITLCVILLFCDAPFLDDFQPYIIIRSGRVRWVVSQILYIMIMSFILLIIINGSILLLSLRTVSFGSDWGKVLNTLAQTDAAYQFEIRLGISYQVILKYTPFEAMALSSFLFWLICVFMGLLMFVINFFTSRTYGAIVGIGFALLTFALSRITTTLVFFSPTAWANIGLFHSNLGISQPTLIYCLSVLIIGISIFSAILIQGIKYKDLHVLPKL